jgi:hypothetical protein
MWSHRGIENTIAAHCALIGKSGRAVQGRVQRNQLHIDLSTQYVVLAFVLGSKMPLLVEGSERNQVLIGIGRSSNMREWRLECWGTKKRGS